MRSLGTKWKTYTDEKKLEILKEERIYLTRIWGETSFEVASWDKMIKAQVGRMET